MLHSRTAFARVCVCAARRVVFLGVCSIFRFVVFASLGAIGKADGKYGPAPPAHLGGVSTESTPRVPLDYPWSTPGVPLVYPLNDLIGAGPAQLRPPTSARTLNAKALPPPE